MNIRLMIVCGVVSVLFVGCKSRDNVVEFKYIFREKAKEEPNYNIKEKKTDFQENTNNTDIGSHQKEQNSYQIVPEQPTEKKSEGVPEKPAREGELIPPQESDSIAFEQAKIQSQIQQKQLYLRQLEDELEKVLYGIKNTLPQDYVQRLIERKNLLLREKEKTTKTLADLFYQFSQFFPHNNLRR